MGADRRVKLDMAVTLQRRQENGEQRLESLSTDAIRRLPEDDERLTNGLVVQSQAPTLRGSQCPGAAIEHANGVLAVVPGEHHEFIQDPPFRVRGASAISLANRVHQLLSRRRTDLRHVRLLRIRLSVANLVRQRSRPSNKLADATRPAEVIVAAQLS